MLRCTNHPSHCFYFTPHNYYRFPLIYPRSVSPFKASAPAHTTSKKRSSFQYSTPNFTTNYPYITSHIQARVTRPCRCPCPFSPPSKAACRSVFIRCEIRTPNPKPQTTNPKPQTPNPQPQTLNSLQAMGGRRSVDPALMKRPPF